MITLQKRSVQILLHCFADDDSLIGETSSNINFKYKNIITW